MSRACQSDFRTTQAFEAPASARSKRNALGSLLLLAGAVVLTWNPEWFNRPVARILASLSKEQHVATQIASMFTENASLQGVVIVGLLWYCWFKQDDATRAALAAGISGAVLSGLISRFLQRNFPSYPKPIYDPGMQEGAGQLGDLITARLNTFPSERATLFVGLAVAIFLVRPRLGMLALGYTLTVDAARVYLGLHYPADLMGSAAIAALLVWITQMPWGLAAGRALVAWENRSPALFYAAAFLVSYQMATAFADVRRVISSLYRLGL